MPFISDRDRTNLIASCKVAAGFYDAEEIFEQACESLEEGWFDDTTDDIEEVTLQKITNYSITKKEKTETDWLNETDCDRRTRAFEELSSIDIITAVAASISSFS